MSEKATCALPGLLALDRQVAAAYAAALARQPDQRDALRQQQLSWLRQRDAACALPTPAISACLRDQLTSRIAALSPANAGTPVAGSAPSAAVSQVTPPIRRLPDPEIPRDAVPQAAARLDADSLPAAEQAETMLHVDVAGRFTLTARGPGGTALQLVDMLTGPSEVAGAPGSQDGRLDPLLDVGTYKIRIFSAKDASGTVSLGVTPFRDAAPPAALPQPGQPLSATLRDGEQRSFWLLVPPSGAVRIDAVGRSLADLRLWRDGRMLEALEPEAIPAEPTPGHPLSRLRLVGKVEPGTYLAVAYGGPAATWTDGDPAQPFHLRAGASEALDAGWADGPVGPFGSEVFTLPTSAALLRLRLPQGSTGPAGAEMVAGDATVSITGDGREPVASLPVTPGSQPVIEVRGSEGQAFTLRALAATGSRTLDKPGTYWVSAVANGAGGDEVPPTVLLQRGDPTGRPARIVADTLPTAAPGPGWRARFNLRGPTRLLARSGGGPVALRTTGVPVRGGRVDANVPDGVYALSLQPQAGVLGALELVLGPPDASPPPAAALPPDPVLPLGAQAVAPGERLELIGASAPGLALGLSARPLPVALAEGSLLVTLLAGQGIEVPVQVAQGGTLAVSEVGGGPTPFLRREEAGRTLVGLPPLDHARTVALAWRRTPSAQAPIPPPATDGALQAMHAGTPVFFDLAEAPRSFDLSVAEGGLFRIETLGRLRTAGKVSTPFIPGLGEGVANGVGQNMLVQTSLRAGRYRVQVSAQDSAGRAGLLATPAPLLETGVLRPGGSVRATLPAGTGAMVPVVVAAAGPMHLDVAGLGEAWQGRLDDEGGWPLTRPGPLDGIERSFAAGRYRLVVEPAAVARQVVLRLRPAARPATVEGHGPHPLPFGTPQSATWREPEGQSAPRTPDRWRFALNGTADVILTLPETMEGFLRQAGTDAVPRRVMRRLKATLDPGTYELEVTSLGRNDRAPYTVALNSTELQPGMSRTVSLPATLPFAIATPRVVSLTSFGSVPMRAVLRDAAGGLVGRYSSRADDWNVAVSRPLPAGAYRLELFPASAPDAVDTLLRDGPASPSSEGSSSDEDSEDAPPKDDQAAQTPGSQATEAAPRRPALSSDTPGEDEATSPKVEVRMALPALLDPVPAPDAAATLQGDGVHVLTLPQPAADSLVVAQAHSSASVALSLERQRGDAWEVVALDEGRTPVVASPAGAAAERWRVRAWTVDGGPDPVRLMARAVSAPLQDAGSPVLAPLAETAAPLAVARVRLAPGLLRLGADAVGLLVGSWPGHALRPVSGGVVLPVPEEVWLLGRAGPVEAAGFVPEDGASVALTVPEGVRVPLPGGNGPQLWLARSGAGQPSLGGNMGWAPGSAVALAGPGVLLGGGDGGSLRVDLRRMTLRLLPEQVLDGTLHAVLPPGAALPLRLPAGSAAYELQLAPGTAAVPDWQRPGPAVWAGDAAVSRKIAGDWTTLLLLNAGSAPAPASLAVLAMPAADPLVAGGLAKRFFGAAGSFELAVQGGPGARLHLAGPGTLAVVGADGRVAEGRDIPMEQAGRAIVRHEAGAVVAWLETPAASPWPRVAAQALSVPARVGLSGPAAAFGLDAAAPILLHAITTAPVLLGMGRSMPDLFPSGAELHRVLPAGATELLLLSPGEGDLTGTLTLRAEPILPIAEGLGPEITVQPGGAAAFGFSLARPATIGVGLRAQPDRVSARLLDASTGAVLGQGVAQLISLQAGRYVLEAQVPPDAPTVVLRPAVVGIAPRPNGPPPDVVQGYLELAGMKPQVTMQGTAP